MTKCDLHVASDAEFKNQMSMCVRTHSVSSFINCMVPFDDGNPMKQRLLGFGGVRKHRFSVQSHTETRDISLVNTWYSTWYLFLVANQSGVQLILSIPKLDIHNNLKKIQIRHTPKSKVLVLQDQRVFTFGCPLDVKSVNGNQLPCSHTKSCCSILPLSIQQRASQSWP